MGDWKNLGGGTAVGYWAASTCRQPQTRDWTEMISRARSYQNWYERAGAFGWRLRRCLILRGSAGRVACHIPAQFMSSV